MSDIAIDLNQLPGYTGIDNVNKVGMPVDECAGYMARFAAIKQMSCMIFSAHMTHIPEWELKACAGRWLYEDARQFALLEQRLKEMRGSRSAIRKVLDYQLGDLLTEILHSPGTLELFTGMFKVLTPALLEAINIYLEDTQPLVDEPSVYLLKHWKTDEEERLAVGLRGLEVLLQEPGADEKSKDWENHFKAFLSYAGGVPGRDEPSARPTPRACEEYRIDREFRRDGRFKLSLPKVTPKVFEGDNLNRMRWVRSQEMTAAEMMATVIYEWEDLPTEALVDMARHCWDEVRHSLFGQAALEDSGTPLDKVESWVGYAKHTLPAPPVKRYSHLAIATEAKAMAYPGGKRGEWEFCRDEAKDPLMTTFQDFDWADEVNHVNYGRKWIVEHACKGNREEARKLADETVAERLAYYAQFENGNAKQDGY